MEGYNRYRNGCDRGKDGSNGNLHEDETTGVSVGFFFAFGSYGYSFS